MADPRIDEATGTPTVGHEWDGIEELDTPMPRWWVWIFIATVVFSIGYVVVYPAIPLANGATTGTFGWSSRADLANDMRAQDGQRAALLTGLADLPIERLPENPAMLQAAVAGGRAAFKVNCVQCHGSGAAGSPGYPNLNDDDWLWGGDLNSIEITLKHGIRHPGDDQTRFSQMPPFGSTLQPPQINAVASHVLSLSGKTPANPAGAALFAANCASCHGTGGRGGRAFGAPNLADAIWLYGSDRAAVVRQINAPRGGVMPAWLGRLDPVTIKMLAAYIHSLGGGEKSPAKPSPAAAPNGTR